VLFYFLSRSLLGRVESIAACAIAGLATSTWTISADDTWTHGPAQVVIVAGILAGRTGRWKIAGGAWGIGFLLRPHVALIGVVQALWDSQRKRRWYPVLCVSSGVASGVVLSLLYYHRIWGEWFLSAPDKCRLCGPLLASNLPSSSLGATFGEFTLDALGSFLSPERGLLLYSPFILLLAFSLKAAWACAPSWVKSAAIGGILYLCIQLLANPFAGGTGFYSYRLTIEFLTACSPLLMLSWREWIRPRFRLQQVFIGLAALSVFIQALGAFGDSHVTWAGSPWEIPGMLLYAADMGWWRLPLAAAFGAGFFATMLGIKQIKGNE